jgi:hypothetical protein
MYTAIICWKLKATKSQQLLVIAGKSCEFLFLYCLFFYACYELATIFMSRDILFGVALLMNELYVMWSSWADLLCWVLINCEQVVDV